MAQQGGGVATDRPLYFFLSYAHSRGLGLQDRFEHDELVHRFEQDLDNAVIELATHPREIIAGLSDHNIPIGGDWHDHLASALARCRSFVALYSGAYFDSPECGREWAAFSARINRDMVKDNVQHNAIIPVVWLPIRPEMLPERVKRVQFTHASLGVDYNMRGLRYLMTHRELRAQYLRAVDFFAARVVEVAENDAPSIMTPIPPYADHPNAFADPARPESTRPRLRIVVAAASLGQLPKGLDPAYYGASARDWRPYVPTYTGVIAKTAGRLAESLGFQVFVEDAEHCRELLERARPTAPTVLFVDPWAIRDHELNERLAAFDRSSPQKSWIRLVVPWNRANRSAAGEHAQLDGRLDTVLGRTRERCRRETPRSVDGLESVEDLISDLPEVFRAAERHFLAAADTHLPRPRPGASGTERPRLRGSRLLSGAFGRGAQPGNGGAVTGEDKTPDDEPGRE